MLSLKHFDCFRVIERSGSINHCLNIWKTSAFSFSDPLIRISVSVKDYFAVSFQCLVDYFIDSLIKVICFFKFICHCLQYICYCSVQYSVGTGDRHWRSYHTELKLVACKSERWCTVTVCSILFDRKDGVNTDIHFFTFVAMRCCTIFEDLLHNVFQLLTKEDRDDCRRCLVSTKTVIVSRVGSGETKQCCVVIYSCNNSS